MAINLSGLSSLLPKLLNTAADALPESGVLRDAANFLLNAGPKLTPEQQLALQTEMDKHEADMLSALNAESIAEIQSPDKYVARARPTGLYIAYACTLGMVTALVLGIKLDTGAMITLLAPCWGQAAWYTANRTKEKIANAA